MPRKLQQQETVGLLDALAAAGEGDLEIIRSRMAAQHWTTDK